MKEKRKVRGSSAITKIEHDAKTKILTVHMQDGPKGQGRVLNYANVPRDVFQAFTAAESKGSFFNSHIRNDYPFVG